MEPSALVAITSPVISARGSAFHFPRPTLAKGKEVGRDGFRLYILGRGGVLGDVEWPVVVSAFGYFKPSLVEKIWDSARTIADPRTTGRRYVEACAAFGRDKLADVDALGAFCQAAERVVWSAELAGAPLFAGLRAEPLADDRPGRATQLVTMLREHRGGVHLVAVLASGLTPITAHYLRRPNDFTAFG